MKQLRTRMRTQSVKRIDLGFIIERLKRGFLRNLAAKPDAPGVKSSLFGSVQGGDVTEDMIEEAKRAVFRPEQDL